MRREYDKNLIFQTVGLFRDHRSLGIVRIVNSEGVAGCLALQEA